MAYSLLFRLCRDGYSRLEISDATSFDGARWTPTIGFEVLGSGLADPSKGLTDAVGNLHVNLQHVSCNRPVSRFITSDLAKFTSV